MFTTDDLLRPLLALLPLVFCTAAETYSPPLKWDGVKVGSTAGNPALVGGVPQWRLDAVVTVDPTDLTIRPDFSEPLHYRPLAWSTDGWRCEVPQYQGAKIINGEVTVAAYGVGQGEFCKNNALVFIAPADGAYDFSSTIDVFCWEGGVQYALVLMKREQRDGAARLTTVDVHPLEIKNGNHVRVAGIMLRKGSELVILPNHVGNYSGAAAIFKGLRLIRKDVAGGYIDVLGAMHEPAQRASAPQVKENPTGINFPLCSSPLDLTQKGGRYQPGLHSAHQCMGIIDVTKPPYNADNTGKTDVSDILTRAIQDSNSYNGMSTKIVYLPDGIYLVSKTVKHRDPGSVGPCVQGQSRNGTVIRLQDGTWPKADGQRHWVLQTGFGVAQNFNRILRNLTISIGRDNDGASGLFFYGNNQSSMSEISIISEDGKGQTGLDLLDGEQGPCLVRNILVKGFKVGVSSGALNAVTFHNLSLEGQSEVGFKNLSHEQWIDGLTSTNRVPAISMDGGALVLINARLSGGNPGVPAITSNSGMVFIRDLVASGYSKALVMADTHAQKVPDGLNIDEYSSGAAVSQFGPPQRSLNLPVKQPPEPPWEQDMGRWASVEWYRRAGLTGAEALQAAIDDPRNTTICVPEHVHITGTETVVVRGTITRIIGTGGSIIGLGSLVIADGGPAVVKIERLGLPRNTYARTSRTVVVEAIVAPWLHHEGSGDLFVSDVCLSVVVNHPKAHLWCWQFNSESQAGGLTLKSGTARIFGWKTEGTSGGRVLATGGTLEIIGFLVYTALTDKSPWPLIEIHDTVFSFASLAQITFGDADKVLYHRLVRETQNAVTREYTGTNMSLYTSRGEPSR